MQKSNKNFYTNYRNEVKTFKEYVLLAIDGSNFKISNTPQARKKYKGNQKNQCARVTVFTLYDVMNKCILDTIVEKYDYMLISNLYSSKNNLNFKNINDNLFDLV